MSAQRIPGNVGWFEFVDIRVGDPSVHVIADRQRPLSEEKVQRLVKEWDEALVGTLEMSEQGDGSIHIPDGQHRYVAALRRHECTVPVKLWHGRTSKEDAQQFLGINVHRAPVRAAARWPVRLLAGDERALQIEQVLARHSCRVVSSKGSHDSPRVIVSCAALERIYDTGGASLLDRTLTLVLAAYPDDHRATSAGLLYGVARMLWAYTDYAGFDVNRLLTRLCDTSYLHVKQKADENIHVYGMNAADAYALAVLAVYNYKLQSGRLPEEQLKKRGIRNRL